MTLIFADRVQETTATTGTGTLTLSGAVSGYQTFASGIVSGNSCCYAISNGGNWEVGSGTIGGSGPYTLSRDTVFSSSSVSGGVPQKITLSGTSFVSNVIPAAKAPFPFTYEGVWSGTSAYPAYAVALYSGDVYVSNTAIAAPATSSVVVSSPTTATPSAATTWNFTYSTSATNRLIFLALQIYNTAAPTNTVTSVSSPNVTWSKLTDNQINGIGFEDYGAIWVGQAGPQLTSEAITISLGGSYAGNILAFDLGGLNFSGTLFDPNGALPNVTTGIGSSSITASFTTSNADDVLLWIAMAADNTISTTPPSGYTFIGEAGPGGSAASAIAFYKTVTGTQSGSTVSTSGGYQAWISVGTAVEYTGAALNVTPANDVRWQRITAISKMFDGVFGSSAGTMAARGTSSWQAVGPLTNGQLPIGSTGALPVATGLSAGTGINISNAAGSVTISSATGQGANGLWSQVMSPTPTQALTGFNTWLNQPSGTTVTNAATGLVVYMPAQGAADVGLLSQTAAATPNSYIALLTGTVPPLTASGTGHFGGPVFGYSDGTKTVAATLQFNTTNGNTLGWALTVTEYSALNSASLTNVAGPFAPITSPVWIKITDDGTNINFYISNDGVSWELLYQQARTSYLSSPSDVVFGAWQASVEQETYATLLSFGAAGNGANYRGLYAPVIPSIPTQTSTGFTTWINQGGATVNNGLNGISINAPASSGDQLRVLYQTAPATPYSVKALVGLTCRPGNYQQVALGWIAGSPPTTSTALQNIAIEYNSGLNFWTLSVDHWSNVTTSVGTDYHIPIMGNPVWLMLTDDGTNFYFKWSVSGDDNDFVTVFSGTKSGGYLGASGYANIAFLVNRNNNDGGGTPAIGTMFAYGT